MSPEYLFAFGLAFVSSICFAGNRAFASKPLLSSNPATLTLITLLVGVLATTGALATSAQTPVLFSASGFVIAIFALVGISHYAVGRQLSYVSIKNIGANTTSPIISMNVIYSMVLAVFLLKEELTLPIGTGVALIVAGVLVMETHSSALKRGGMHNYGYLAAVLTGAIFGTTPIAISFGLGIYDHPIAATFIAYVAAAIAFMLAGNARKMFSEIAKTPRSTLIPFVISSVFAATAQLTRFAALSYAPVVLVAPVLSTNPVFTVIMTRRTAKDVEVFTPRTIGGITLAIIGSILVVV